MKKLLFTIDYAVPTHSGKKNSRPIHRSRSGKPFLGKSIKGQVLENLHTGNMIRHRLFNKLQTIEDSITAEFLFVFPKDVFFIKPKKKDEPIRRSKTLGDLSNLIQLPEDCLQASGLIANDSLIMSYGNSGIRYWNQSEHRLVINLFTFDEDLEYHQGR